MRLLIVAALPLSACAATVAPPTPDGRMPTAAATLVDAAGAVKGEVTLRQVTRGVDVMLAARDMAPGTYAFHIHAVGECAAPDFTSAGPHYNPTGARHGAHKGDLPNVVIDATAAGRTSATIAEVTLADVLDADGAAAIIHARPDDGVTDPTGNAGPRLACGVIAPK
jgi:Cu-Zn family superoxide dismutase